MGSRKIVPVDLCCSLVKKSKKAKTKAKNSFQISFDLMSAMSFLQIGKNFKKIKIGEGGTIYF